MTPDDIPSTMPVIGADRAELEQAFTLFTEASRQLVESYQDLEQRVGSLTEELAVANGALRQQFEEKLALSRRLETLLSALPGGVIELDTAGRILTANPAARAIFGDAIAADDWSVVMPRLTPSAVAEEWVWDAGELTERRLSIVESLLSSGERILLVHDLSESWRLRRQLEQHKRLAAMGEMAAGLAHQLRTPLATALLYTANLTRAHIGDAERIRFGEKSLARLRHLEALIQNMLQFVRGQQADMERVDLVAAAEEAIQTVMPHEGDKPRHWLVSLGECEAWVSANRKELAGVLTNLLENAVQATSQGDRIAVTLALEGGEWLFVVADSGSGMTESVRERLFEPFFTTRKEGTGLGLAIVRNLINAYGGEIDVVSAPGEGASFMIRLPVAP